QLKNFDLAELKGMSKFAKYSDKEFTDIDAFFNIYVSFMQTKFAKEFPQNLPQRNADLELVGLAALADIMPLKNENRIFIRHALATINAGKIRPGLLELMSQLDMLKKKVSSIDLSWTVVPNLNAAGRLGHAELAAQLFLTEDAKERYNIAEKIKKLNLERKELGAEAWNYALPKAEESIKAYNGNLCVIIDERINRGVNGILAGQLVHAFNVPAITITFTDEETAVGSMRSCRGLKVPDFLDKFDSIFINHGGHLAAGGFSFYKKDLETFKKMLLDFSKDIKLEEAKEDFIEVDAELPAEYMHPDILKLIDEFEPYGEENPSLTFMSRGLPVIDAQILGKAEPLHLKLLFDCGNTKWPALFWK
ncbi:MAG: DHH family phosphoesterase, partial [Treponema sp.]|nr:DHH family phosphoesterase [Treponema sp.]